MRCEIEAQLEAPSKLELAKLPPALEALGAFVSDPETCFVQDHYLDTADLHFLGAGWALRLRNCGSRQVLGLKELRPPQEGLAVREEIEEEVHLADGQSFEFPPGVLAGRLARICDTQKLMRLFMIRQERVQHQVVLGDGLELGASRDSVHLESGSEGESLWVAELELRQGREEQLRQLCASLEESLGWNKAARSKFERGLSIAGLAPPGTRF